MIIRIALNLFSLLILSACSTSSSSTAVSQNNQTPSKSSDSRLKLIDTKRKELSVTAGPLKGRFLDYIYLIQPDHKQEGYSISAAYLSDGYAYGSGPYDGWFVEFFLFRGTNNDLVLKQMSGYEVDEKKLVYGFQIEPYSFQNGKMKKIPIQSVLPIKEIDLLFQKQLDNLKSNQSINTTGWTYYKLLRLPIKGTSSVLKVCSENPEPPFSISVKCASVGTLLWNKAKFTLEKASKFELSNEKI